MKGIHGGDIYRNQVLMDFSVNVNPLGMPQAVVRALHEAVESCGVYPDITAEKLKAAVSEMLGVPKEWLLFGNGASELFMAVVHALKPGRAVIPVPSFYGYEHAARAGGGEILYYVMTEENAFLPGEDLFDMLTEEIDLLFLANPNNPTGALIKEEELKALLQHCREKGIYVVLDECFIEFCAGAVSMLSVIEQFENLILIRAFTKIFALPGVRLGYLVCKNQRLLEDVLNQLPEWNLSVFAQEAGCVCAKQQAFVKETVEYVQREREFLMEHLQRLGFRVFQGEADFLLLWSEKPLYERLLEYGILIRDCKNFRGLTEGYYRIAVRTREENKKLLERLEKLEEENGKFVSLF